MTSDKLSGIKSGDRVRVTFEGEMSETSAVHFWPVVSDGMSAPTMWVMPDVHCQPQIERIEPPLKVGDRVSWKQQRPMPGWDVVEGVVRALVDGYAVVTAGKGEHLLMPASDLERIA